MITISRKNTAFPFSYDLKAAQDFTSTYQLHQHCDPAKREAWCLATQYETYFIPMMPGDRLAGRVRYPMVGFGTENTSGGSLYYCKKSRLRQGAKEAGISAPEDLITYWEGEIFMDDDLPRDEPIINGKLLWRLPEQLLKDTTNSIANMGGRVAGTVLDFDKLVRLGISGLREEVLAARAVNKDVQGEPLPLYEAMLMSLDAVSAVCTRYELQARSMAELAVSIEEQGQLHKLAAALAEIAEAAPTSFLAGLQLLWIYANAAFTVNYGRMDVAMGDLLAKELDAGALTETEALSYLQTLWQMMTARKISAREISEFNARVILGGLGRRNVSNADRFAMLAMEASRTVIETEPQLTLRVYKGMNPILMDKALSVIGEGRVYPMLYNDDVNVPAAMKAFGISGDEALDYIPYGCGEYAIDHQSVGSPNCSLNLLKALEVALHDGKDALTNKTVGLKTGPLESLTSFEKLYSAYTTQVEYFIRQLGERHKIEYQVEGEEAALNLASLLYDGTVESGKSILNRGTRYTGAIIESFGMVNTADSLTAIKTLIFDKKLLSLEALVQALDTNFAGLETLHKQLLDAPKYGNDNDAADTMLQRVSNHACHHAKDMATSLDFDYFLLVNINNYYNVELGKITAASAEGRICGGPLANGSTPTAGMDKQGVTAMMNSLAKIPADCHAGYSHNMKFAKSVFAENKKQVAYLLDGYFANGGTQAMLTVVDKKDLEDARVNPEQHYNLIVRVGGFSARFIELSKEVQQDIINRTMHTV